MLKSNLKNFVVLGVVALGIVLFSLWQTQQPRAGKKIFPATFSEFSIDGLHFINRDGLWVVDEFDNYYANIDLIKNVLYVFDMAEYVQKTSVNKTNPSKIRINNQKFNLYDGVVENGGDAWQMSFSVKLPNEKYEYLTNPLIYIDYMRVSSLKIDDVSWRFVDPSFINILNNFKFVDVKREIKEAKLKDVQITLSSGLIINIAYYNNDWVSISYEKFNVFEKGVKEIIENYSMLTDGWYFKL